MLGINRTTNLAGWVTLAFQLAKVLIPFFTGEPLDDMVVQGLDHAALTTASLGLLGAKDKSVTGAGAIGPNAARRAE